MLGLVGGGVGWGVSRLGGELAHRACQLELHTYVEWRRGERLHAGELHTYVGCMRRRQRRRAGRRLGSEAQHARARYGASGDVAHSLRDRRRFAQQIELRMRFVNFVIAQQSEPRMRFVNFVIAQQIELRMRFVNFVIAQQSELRMRFVNEHLKLKELIARVL